MRAEQLNSYMKYQIFEDIFMRLQPDFELVQALALDVDEMYRLAALACKTLVRRICSLGVMVSHTFK